jgi:hypothetical protein
VHPALREETVRLARVAASGGIAAAAVMGARILTETVHYGVPCPLLAATGVPCPTCHGLRSLALLGRGEIGKALSENPFFAAAALLLVAAGAVAGVLLLSRRSTLPWRPGAKGSRALGWGILIALAANWLLLILRE